MRWKVALDTPDDWLECEYYGELWIAVYHDGRRVFVTLNLDYTDKQLVAMYGLYMQGREEGEEAMKAQFRKMLGVGGCSNDDRPDDWR
jgi:hypothetical protein